MSNQNRISKTLKYDNAKLVIFAKKNQIFKSIDESVNIRVKNVSIIVDDKIVVFDIEIIDFRIEKVDIIRFSIVVVVTLVNEIRI